MRSCGRAIAAIQFNDAPKGQADLLTETVTARLLPGEGAIDLVDIIHAWDAIGVTAPIGEIFSVELDKFPPSRRRGERRRPRGGLETGATVTRYLDSQGRFSLLVCISPSAPLLQ